MMFPPAAAATALAAVFSTSAGATNDPYADSVVSFDQGSFNLGNDAELAQSVFSDPLTTLGPPERFTGEALFPGCVTAFYPAYGVDEIVSIGRGGHLTLHFDPPIINDARNRFGIDFIVYGNSFFIDTLSGSGRAGAIVADGGRIAVSADGVEWFEIPDVLADGLYPTIGYLDAGPFDTSPGNSLTVFTRPVDPSLTAANFLGLFNNEIIEAYHGAAGGAGVDLGSVGLHEISYVRITVDDLPEQAPIEIDAVVDASLPGDLDGSGTVGQGDLNQLLNRWGDPACLSMLCVEDLDGLNGVGQSDLNILLNNWE